MLKSPPSIYNQFLSQLRQVAYIGPKPPKKFNTHLQVMSPFDKQPIGQKDPSYNLIAIKSNRHKSINPSGIPFPSVITRHMLNPTKALEKETALGKVIGFRMEVKGRMGSRSVKRAYHYGSLNSSNSSPISGSMIDFGQSSYVTKRGVTGVKVWIAYGTK